MKFEVELNAEQIRHLQSLNREYPEPYKWYSEISPMPPMLKAIAERLQSIEVGDTVYRASDKDGETYKVLFVGKHRYFVVSDDSNEEFSIELGRREFKKLK